MSWSQILVPTDFSEPAATALDSALDLASVLGAGVTILHAYHLVIPMSVPPTGGGFRMPASAARELRARAREAVEELVERRSGSGVEMTARAVEAPPATAILSEAERIPADLIVMGTHGRSGLAHAFLGSVAERVVRMAGCPVLTMRAGGG